MGSDSSTPAVVTVLPNTTPVAPTAPVTMGKKRGARGGVPSSGYWSGIESHTDEEGAREALRRARNAPAGADYSQSKLLLCVLWLSFASP